MSINMRRVVVILITSISLAGCIHDETAWEVAYGWSSGWGNSPMYKINSKGEMELIKPYPDDVKNQCTQKLDGGRLSIIKSKIDTIPASLPQETEIRYLDNCADEREDYIFITEGLNQQGFSFSQSAECRRTEIPAWLDNLNKELAQFKSIIDGCPVEKAHNKKG